jgi:hypothetical protein
MYVNQEVTSFTKLTCFRLNCGRTEDVAGDCARVGAGILNFFKDIIVLSYRRYCNAHCAQSRIIPGTDILHAALWSLKSMFSDS